MILTSLSRSKRNWMKFQIQATTMPHFTFIVGRMSYFHVNACIWRSFTYDSKLRSFWSHLKSKCLIWFNRKCNCKSDDIFDDVIFNLRISNHAQWTRSIHISLQSQDQVTLTFDHWVLYSKVNVSMQIINITVYFSGSMKLTVAWLKS